MNKKDILMYTLSFLIAFGVFFAYLWWKNQGANTLPDVYGVM